MIGEASESEDDSDTRSDSSLDSKTDLTDLNNANSSALSMNSKSAYSLHSTKSNRSNQATSPLLSMKSREDPFTASTNVQVDHHNNLITDKLIRDNGVLRSSIVSFGAQRYQTTIDELNELNQNLIKSQEKIQSANLYLEKTKCNLSSLNDNLDAVFRDFGNCKLKL